MFSNSRANAQQRDSIIRTRSQQQHPLMPVDMYASPLKEAIRNHNHHNHTLRHAENNHAGAPVGSQSIELPSGDAADEVSPLPAYKKRVSSPSFSTSTHPGKRIRVFGQSSKVNSLSHQHSEESLGSPHLDSTELPAKALHSTWEGVSCGSPDKGIVHLDLTRMPHSPSKPPCTPTKTFTITTDGGQTMRVPITPGKGASGGGSGLPTLGATPTALSSSPQNQNNVQQFRSSPSLAAFVPLSTSPLKQQITSPHRPTLSFPPLSGIGVTHDTFHCTPIRRGLAGEGSVFDGSLLAPLPTTPHLNGATLRHITPQSTSDKGLATIPSNPAPDSSSSLGPLATAGQSSPTKSRIPIPSSSSTARVLGPLSSLAVSALAAARPSSPIQTPRRPSPLNPKPRIKGKVRPSVRSKAPLTRLAAKRSVRRASSSGPGLYATDSSSTGCNAVPSSSETIGPSNSNSKCVISGTIPKKSLVTSSRLSTENANPSRTTSQPSSNSTSTSPTKQTPLSALSTALQKLLVAAPAAPAPRPRPSTSLGLTKSTPFSLQTTYAPQPSRGMDGNSNAHGDPGRNGSGFPRPKTSLGHSRLPGRATGLGKLGLPLRRPAFVGRLAPGNGAPFASKQTNLSTVPASPAKSAGSPSEHNLLSGSQDTSADIFDVDAWHPRVQGNNDKHKSNESNLEYFIPVADESRPNTQPQPPELVSPSRRASQASIALTQSLSLPRGRMPIHSKVARSASTSAAARPPNPRTPVKTRGRTKARPTSLDPPADGIAAAMHSDPMGGKRSNARMPGSLDILKDCIIFVDVRTEEGEDAAALFIDMLRGLGARILAKPGKSCTHLVYKSGLPSTITKYKLLSEPRPLPVSIGWVVECVEKRAHVDETRFLVNLHDIGVAGGAQRRRSMQPKQMRTMTLGQLDNGEPAEISVRADSSFTSEEPSTSGPVLVGLSPPMRSPDNNLPPLQRARQRSLQILPE